MLAASIPPLLAVLGDPEAHGFDEAAREVVMGLGLGLDRSGTPPIGQLLAPLAVFVPIGSIELRAAIALSVPAAIATFLVARRIDAPEATARAKGAWAIALAFASTAGVLLGVSPPSIALAVIAIELALLDDHGFGALAARGAAVLLATWSAPRLSPALVAAIFLARPPPDAHGARRAALGMLPCVGIAAAIALSRGDAWLSIGRALVSPTFAPATSVLPSGAVLRAALAMTVLGFGARLLLREPTRAERAAPWIAGIALVCAIVLRAPGGAIVASVALSPLAVSFARALSIAVERHLAKAGRQAIVFLVPALCLGLGARAFEVELGARRIGEAAAAHDAAALLTIGIAPARGVVIVEEEDALLRLAHARIVHGVRPDLRVLPAQVLAASGAARMATATIGEIPSAAAPLRALLARGALEAADTAPLALDAAVLVDLPFARLRGVARHVSPTGGPLVIALERVDPSDRRLRRPALERRLGFLARALAGRPIDDRVRGALRVGATREARALSAALDRDGALAAIARAAALGADADRAARWTAKVTAKQPIDAEPPTPDD